MRVAVRVAAVVVVVAGVVAGWASPTIPGRADFFPITAERAVQVLTAATVQVEAFGCNLQRRDGTGVVVAPGLVLSNRHVVGDSRLVDVNADGQATVEAGSPAVAFSGDVGHVAVDGLDGPVLALSRADPGTGSTVWIAGFPSRSPGLVVEQQTVTAYLPGKPFGQPWEVMRLSQSARQGMSGGPVLDGAGHLAGILFGNEVPTGQALAIPASALRGVLSAGAFRSAGC